MRQRIGMGDLADAIGCQQTGLFWVIAGETPGSGANKRHYG